MKYTLRIWTEMEEIYETCSAAKAKYYILTNRKYVSKYMSPVPHHQDKHEKYQLLRQTMQIKK